MIHRKIKLVVKICCDSFTPYHDLMKIHRKIGRNGINVECRVEPRRDSCYLIHNKLVMVYYNYDWLVPYSFRLMQGVG